jgi:hypothetical protein
VFYITVVALTVGEDIANYIYEHTTRETLDLDLQGIWINDREPHLMPGCWFRSFLA